MEKNIYNPEYVKGLFNRMSSSYERMNYLTSFGFSIRWRKEFLTPFQNNNKKAEVIDLLTGMGETWSATKHKLPNSNLTVLDFSEGMLNYAKQKNKKRFNDEIIVLQQDILQNKLPSNHFDFVTCAFGLKTFNTEQLSILAKETKRILKVGGHFSFIEVSKPNNKILRAFYGFYLWYALSTSIGFVAKKAGSCLETLKNIKCFGNIPKDLAMLNKRQKYFQKQD